jgi:hypothetical protein
LVQLQNVSLRIRQRITCDEEERQRFGYKLVSSYRFPEVGGKLDRKDAEVYVGDALIMRLRPSATPSPVVASAATASQP